MKKRLSALILAMLMILSICPVAMATAEYKPTIAKTVIYDAHITGNFVVGGTLTAEYSYTIDETHTQLNVANTDATITWYNMDRYGSRKELGTGKTYVIPEDYLATYAGTTARGIFFTVTAANGETTPVKGNTYYSHFHNQPVAKAAEGAAEAPVVMNVGIVPQNPEGTMNVGDTVVARYTYRETTAAEEGATTFAWYTRDGISGERSTVLGNGETYEIKAADYGKILEVDVTPVTENKTTGTTVTAINHVGNLLFSKDAVVTLTGFRGYSNYREEYFLANGNSRDGTNLEQSVSGHMLATGGLDRAVVFDFGKIIPIDGLYLFTGTKLNNFNIYASSDGATWSETPIKTATIDTANKKYEIPFDNVIYTQYLKVMFDCVPKTYNEDGSVKTYTESTIYDMYPYLSGDKWISCDEAFAYASAGKLEVAAWNTPGNVILNNLKKSPAATLAITDAEGNPSSDNFKVTEDLEGKYVKVTGADGKSSLHEITYAGDIIEKDDNEVTVTSTTTSGNDDALIDANFAGDDNGKYLFSAKVYVPDSCDVRLGFYMGGNTWKTGSYQQNLVQFADTNNAVNCTVGSSVVSQHSFIPGKWYDVNVILDYSLWNGMAALGKMNYSYWVDGVELRKSATVNHPAVAKFTNDYLYIDLGVTKGEHTAKAKDISLRKLWDKADFVPENNYGLTLKYNDEAVTGTLIPQESYSLENNIGIYKNTITSIDNYLAVFNVTYNGGTEVSRTLDSVVKGSDLKTFIVEPISNADGTVTKQEVRAFCFSDTLVPLVKMGEWK